MDETRSIEFPPESEATEALLRLQAAAHGGDALLMEAADEMAALRKDAKRLDWLQRQHLEELSMQLVVDAKHDGQYYVCGYSNKPGYGPTLRAAIDAAMLAG